MELVNEFMVGAWELEGFSVKLSLTRVYISWDMAKTEDLGY